MAGQNGVPALNDMVSLDEVNKFYLQNVDMRHEFWINFMETNDLINE